MADSLTMVFNTQRFANRIRRFIRRFPQVSDRIVFEAASDVLTDIKIGWPVDTTVSVNAWSGPHQVANAVYQLRNPLRYPIVIEYGLYPGVGPKTEQQSGVTLPGGIQIGSGVYPVQRPSAPARRALSKNRNLIPEKLAKAIRQEWGV